MAAGSDTISVVPATCTQGPKKPSENPHTQARAFRRRFRAFAAVSRVLTTTRPSASTPTVTGESCGEPSARVVARTARWFVRRKSSAWGMSMPPSWPAAPGLAGRPPAPAEREPAGAGGSRSGVLALRVLEPEERALPAVGALL